MGTINWGRVVLGGLLAGLILTVVDFVVNGVLLVDRWNAALGALGKDEMGGGMIVWFVLFDFLVGIFLIWLYAAIRPRYGAGPRTAVIAGLAVWLLLGALHAMAEMPMGLFPNNLYLVNVAVFLVMAPVAAAVGAWPYQEA